MNIHNFTLSPLSQCKNSQVWNFWPLKAGSAQWPTMAFCDSHGAVHLFTPPPSEQILICHKPPTTWLQLFKETYPELTLPEMARLLQQPHQEFFSVEELLQAYNWRVQENLFSLLKLIPRLTLEQQNWLSKKEMQLQDLQIALSVDFALFQQSVEFVQTHAFSKSQAVSAIEWICELLASKSISEIPSFVGSAEDVFNELKKIRYPQTYQRDQSQQDTFQKIWPSTVKAQFQRRGDRGGFEVRFFAASPVELKKTLLSLDPVLEKWTSQ